MHYPLFLVYWIQRPLQELVLDHPSQKSINRTRKKKQYAIQKTCHQGGRPCLTLVIHPIRKLKDKQTKLRIVSSDRSVYLQYHHVKIGVQVVQTYSIALNQVTILFRKSPFTQNFCVTPHGMTKTFNITKLLNNDTSKKW